VDIRSSARFDRMRQAASAKFYSHYFSIEIRTGRRASVEGDQLPFGFPVRMLRRRQA
jgi:hypothetical protein